MMNAMGGGGKGLAKDFLVSLIYTIVVILLVCIGWLKSPLNYF
jgi:hypothetical protein